MTEYAKKVDTACEPFWEPLRAGLGRALNAQAFPVGCSWQAKPEDLEATPDELRDAMIFGLRSGGRWAESMPKDATKEQEALKASDSKWRASRRLARLFVGYHAQSAFSTLCRLGAIGPAVDAMEAVAPEFDGKWECVEICARMLRAALDGPAREFKDPLTRAERVERVLASKWWDAKIDPMETMRDGREPMAYALAFLARAASFDPALAELSGLAVRKSLPLWLGDMGAGGPMADELVEHFGRKLAGNLGHEKIRGGAVPEPFWRELPWTARLGFSQQLGSKSKMGAWSRGRLLADLSSGADPRAIDRSQRATAAFWLSFDLGAIEMLEAAFPKVSSQWLRPGIEERMGRGGALAWHEVEMSWKDSRAGAWARKMAAKAGVEAPSRGADRAEVASRWAHLCEGLSALREQEALAREVKEAALLRAGKAAKPGAKAAKGKLGGSGKPETPPKRRL